MTTYFVALAFILRIYGSVEARPPPPSPLNHSPQCVGTTSVSSQKEAVNSIETSTKDLHRIYGLLLARY